MTRVAIFGGGIGGLTVAHELITRGFEVDLYEKGAACGGKARSLEQAGTGTGGRPDLPGEHGFRFFPGFYQHLDDTMKRIPLVGGESAFDHLVDAKAFAIAQENKDLYNLPVSNPRNLEEWTDAITDFAGNKGLGLASGEKTVLVERILRLLSMCRERRESEYECTSWWEYHNYPDPRSDQYNKLFVTGFSRSLVAMDAHRASTWTGANLLSQFFKVFFGEGTMDRALDGPTNDVWFSPWVTWLDNQGVSFHKQEQLTHLVVHTAGGQSTISGAKVKNTQNGGTTPVTADYYVAAVPLEAMQALVESDSDLPDAAPSLDRILNLEVSWMNGIVFYLKNDVPLVPGHVNFADSKWALTGISQAQFWNDPPTDFGDGTINGILSIVISDWNETAGDKVHQKVAEECLSAAEVAEETWAQIMPHLPAAATAQLTNADPVGFFLDTAITFDPQMEPPTQNAEPLLINTACSLANRPEAATEIANLMLASDYVKTNIDLATMEGANEAGRRAVNAILDASASTNARCGVWEYKEPIVFRAAQYVDRLFFEAGLPYYFDFPLP